MFKKAKKHFMIEFANHSLRTNHGSKHEYIFLVNWLYKIALLFLVSMIFCITKVKDAFNFFELLLDILFLLGKMPKCSFLLLG